MINGINSLTYNLLKSSIDASSARSKVISNNISNINTPGFKASSVSFEDNLNKIIKGENVSLTTTNKMHINDTDGSVQGYKIETDNSTSMRNDGNNVDIDKEMVKLSENNMYYNFLISRINGQISSRRYVITEGRK